MKEKKIKNNKFEQTKDPQVENIYFLSVFSPFRTYKRGDLITDDEEVIKILNSHEKSMVNKINKFK